jgi:hypothetical protein
MHHISLTKLDENIRELVIALKQFPGITVIASCGGHDNPEPGQKPPNQWLVSFYIRDTMAGRKSLEFLVWAVDGIYQARPHRGTVMIKVSPHYTGNRRWWTVSGVDSDPNLLAHWLMQLQAHCYDDGILAHEEQYRDLWFLDSLPSS